jgi:glycosyltransferase involved in cell wall biosynthesis
MANSSNPKVSVIVPNYNHARFLRLRLDSIFGQPFQDFELTVLDDCSTDASRSIISEYANNPRLNGLSHYKLCISLHSMPHNFCNAVVSGPSDISMGGRR